MTRFLKHVSTLRGISVLRQAQTLRVIVIFISILGISNCGSLFRHSDSNNNVSELIKIPISASPQNKASLELSTAATSITVQITGCSSGMTFGPSVVTSGFIYLYKGDQNCLVKLNSFVYNANTYSATATGATNFTAWTAGNYGTFANTVLSTDLIDVGISAQVTQSGVLSTDLIRYYFAFNNSLTTQTFPTVAVSGGNSVINTTTPAPNFNMLQARYLGVNASDQLQLSFTLQCGSTLTGSSAATYACDGILLQSQMDYLLIPDTYSPHPLAFSDATAAFTANTPVTLGTLITAPGGTDLNSNTLPRGGFYTSNASPLLTSAFSSTSDNFIFIVRNKDANGTSLSFLYFQIIVDLNPMSSQGGCGIYFANGLGTNTNPFLIGDAIALKNTQYCTSSSTYFVQTNNIDLGGADTPWAPIPLYGQYTGANYNITGLYITSTNVNGGLNVGLFSTINSGATVRDVNLVSVEVTAGGANIGALAGSSSGFVYHCTSTGLVQTGFGIAQNINIGGLIGIVTATSVVASTSQATVKWMATSMSGTVVNMGGLIGSFGGTIVANSAYGGTISAIQAVATNAVGGLVGNVTAGTITNSYALPTMTVNPGTATGNQYIGGLLGLTSASIATTSSFVVGSMTITRNVSITTATYYMGGLVGNNGASGSSITNCYTMVTMTVTTPIATDVYGGLAGAAVTVSTSYSANPSMTLTNGVGFAKTITTCTNCYLYANGSVPAQTLTGLTSYTTTTEMQTQSSFTGFDFTTKPVWIMPTANALAPAGLTSPVLASQCTNSVSCNSNSRVSLLNGNFNEGSFNEFNNSDDYFNAGATNLYYWTIGVGSIEVISVIGSGGFAGAFLGTTGGYTIDLSGTGSGSISESVLTNSGTTYTLYFDMGGNPNCGNGTKTMTVTAAAASTNYSFDTTGLTSTSPMPWASKQFTFTATSNSTNITFTDTSGNSCGTLLTNFH